MPLPFDFHQRKTSSTDFYSFSAATKFKTNTAHFGGFIVEPNSVLDNNIISSPSPPTSASTLSSSYGGGVAAVSGKPKWPPAQQDETTAAPDGGVPDKCGMGLEDWESVLSESVAASPGQDQSILRWIMGDVEDPSMALNRVLQIGGGGGGASHTPSADFEFNSGFGVVDQAGFMFDPSVNFINNPSGSSFPKMGLNLNPLQQNYPMFETEIKPQIFNNAQQQVILHQNQAHHQQNPAFFLPSYEEQDQHHHVFTQPNPKRHNPGQPLDSGPKSPFLDSGQPHQLHLLQPHLQQRAAAKLKSGNNEEFPPHQQGVIDQLYKAAELIESGNPAQAQGILARLNQHLSPIGKPFHRAAFYIKESLQSLIHPSNPPNPNPNLASPFSLIFKIGSYKSFSEISPIVQFANFTCNQALLEALDGYDRIHLIDFDIGYGGQWASLMQELALRCGGPPSVKITAFVSPSTHDQLELGLARDNLTHFAADINIPLEFLVLSIDSLNSNSWPFPLQNTNEGIAVNLPVGSFFNYQLSLPSVLRFVKNLSPKIVVSVDRGCDRTDLPFPNQVIHVLQSYSNLLESLDAVNVNLDALQKIERFLLQPGIEKIVMSRYRSPEKTQHWRTLFLTAGFTPLTFSNFTESQAECVVKRTPIRGFHVEKRQSSLVLCWQRRELISASVWRC